MQCNWLLHAHRHVILSTIEAIAITARHGAVMHKIPLLDSSP
jgi:hypothetical protein